MKTEKSTELSFDSLRENRLTRYCAAGVGAAVCAGVVTTADAEIVFVDFNDQLVVDSAPGNGFFGLTTFDLNSDGQIDFQWGVGNGEAFGGAAAIFSPAANGLGVAGFSSGGFYYASRLAAGALIGPGALGLYLSSGTYRADLAFGVGYPNSQFIDGQQGYVGISFDIGGSTVFGWLRISVASNTEPGARNITFYDAAFQTDGTGIQAGAIPEPTTTSLGLLALGMGGLIAHRRRLAAKKAA